MTSALASPVPSGLNRGAFTQKRYTIKRPFFTLFGRTFRVFGEDGQLVLFARHKLMTLKDEWNIYADEEERRPQLHVKARELIAINPTSEITDVPSGQRVASVRLKGLKSIFRDTWEVLSETDQIVGAFAETSNSLLRRFIPLLVGHWALDLNGRVIGRLDQVFRFFTKEFTVELEGSPSENEVRLMLACSMLALMREVSRESRSGD